MGNPGDGGEYQPTAKSLLIFPPEKFSLINLHLALSKVSFLPHKQQFSFNYPVKLHLQLQSLLLYHFCLNSSFMYSHAMPILINRCLMNFVLSTIKALNSQSSPPFNSNLSPNPCFPLFNTPFFISNFIKVQLTSVQLGLHDLYANQI